MWLVTQHGFYNVVQYPEDKRTDLLTIKARRKGDLVELRKLIALGKIEDGAETGADYRYRVKAMRSDVQAGMGEMIGRIDYAKTKGRVHEVHPDREEIYLSTWNVLCELDEPRHLTANPASG